MKYILLGILLLFSCLSYCQENIYGTYESEDGLIMIKPVRDEGDFLLYYEKYTNDKGVRYKARAVCKIEKTEEAEQLIKLNSIGARSSIYNGIEVTKQLWQTNMGGNYKKTFPPKLFLITISNLRTKCHLKQWDTISKSAETTFF